MLKQPVFSLRRRVLGRAVALALLCATGYAAWAAQPAQPSISTVPLGKIAADIVLSVDDGDPVRLRAVADAGVPFSVDARHDGKHYVIASTVDRTQVDGKAVMKMRMRITEDGKLLTEPAIAVENGKAARIQVGEEIAGKVGSAPFKGLRLDIVLNDSMPIALHAAKSSPASASATSSKPKPITARQAAASTPGDFNTYERMLTSLSASWTPPKPPQDDC